jgi:hypothetical protein
MSLTMSHRWPPGPREGGPGVTAATAPAQDEATLRAQLAALEEQLEVARLHEQARQLQAQLDAQIDAQIDAQVDAQRGSADPEGGYDDEEEETYDDEDIEEEIIVIEEILEDGEEEFVEIIDEEYYDDSEVYEEEEYYEQQEESEYVEEYEEEEVVDDDDVGSDDVDEEEEPAVVPVQAFQPAKTTPAARLSAKPMVPLVDPPKAQDPPANVPVSAPAPAKTTSPSSFGPPKAIPAKDASPTPVLVKDGKSLYNEKPQPRKKWVPMSQRFPDKFKSTSLMTRKGLAATGGAGADGAAAADKPKKLPPLPFKPRAYPTTAVSPAGQETVMEKMLGEKLLKNVKFQKVSVNAAIEGQELVCLYFGAAWRKECKDLHQKLIDFYKLTSKDENIEVVYVSVDRTLFEFKDVFQKFPFLAMPTGTTELKNALTKQLHITDLPVMAVFEVATGNVVTIEAATQVRDLPVRDKAAAIRLVQAWKQQKGVPVNKLKAEKKLVAKPNNKGKVYWHNP